MSDEWNWDALLRGDAPARGHPLDPIVGQVLAVHRQEVIEQEAGAARCWWGTLKLPADEALAQLRAPFAQAEYTPLLQEGSSPDEIALMAVPGVVVPTSSRLWLAQLLFVLTVASTVVTGAGGQETCTGPILWDWGNGLMYSGGLLAILLAHELGHFIASRRLGVAVSYPFFIPMPLAAFGTMGAFIQMKEPPPDRRALFTIAVAGPLAGLALAIPLTLIGLALSTVEPFPTTMSYAIEGNSLLYGAMKWLTFGEWLPTATRDVWLHPLASAGWAGLFVTAVNLLPAGQLDGGHIVYALLGGRRAQWVTYGVILLMALMGFVWSGWWLWALLVFFLSRAHAPILNSVTPLRPRQRLLGLVTLIFFALLFTPVPMILVDLCS